MVAVGLVCGLLGIETARIEEMILKRYAHKGDVGEANIRSLLAGAALRARRSFRPAGHTLSPPAAEQADRVLLSGNQAVCLGALHAGLDYYAGYPITPASDILEWLAGRLPKFGGVAIQTEDEIAALASVLGRLVCGQEGDDRHLRPRPVADGGAGGPRRDGGDPGGDRRRPALGPVDRACPRRPSSRTSTTRSTAATARRRAS